MKKIFFLLFITLSISINSQSIFGVWESRNEDTNKVDSYVEIYKKGDLAYAKIVEITNPSRKNALCTLCEGENKNQPILGLNILTGLKKDGDEWSGGSILDPRNGKVYQCYIKLVNKNKLKIRGFIGVSLFGKTAYWHRKN